MNKCAIILITLTGLAFHVLLRAQSVDSEAMILKKHIAPVKALAYNSDGSVLASAGDDKVVYLWNTATGDLMGSFDVFFMIKDLQFTPQGELLAASGRDIILLNMSGEIIRTYKGYTTDVWSLSYSWLTGKVTGGSYSKSIRIWDFTTAATYRLLEGHEKSCLPVCLDPSGTLLASGSLDNSVRLWDVNKGEELHKMELHSGNVFTLAFHPSGKLLLSGSADKTIRLWNVETGEIIRTYTGHEGAVLSVRFSNNGKHFLSCSADRTIVLWETATGNRLYTFNSHNDIVNCIRFSPDGNSFASASDDQTVCIRRLGKNCYTDYYYLNEIEKARAASSLFEPRRNGETRQEYIDRTNKANDYLNELYGEYYEKYIEQLNLIDP